MQGKEGFCRYNLLTSLSVMLSRSNGCIYQLACESLFYRREENSVQDMRFSTFHSKIIEILLGKSNKVDLIGDTQICTVSVNKRFM